MRISKRRECAKWKRWRRTDPRGQELAQQIQPSAEERTTQTRFSTRNCTNTWEARPRTKMWEGQCKREWMQCPRTQESVSRCNWTWIPPSAWTTKVTNQLSRQRSHDLRLRSKRRQTRYTSGEEMNRQPMQTHLSDGTEALQMDLRQMLSGRSDYMIS